MNIPCVLVVSPEGIRTVDEVSRDVLNNVMIKAISYSTEIKGKKVELFAFIESDERLDHVVCHVALCSRGDPDALCDVSTRHVQRSCV